jgi:hypothetical protein
MDRLPFKRRAKVLIPVQRRSVDSDGLEMDGGLPSSQLRLSGMARGSTTSTSSSSSLAFGSGAAKRGRFTEGLYTNLFLLIMKISQYFEFFSVYDIMFICLLDLLQCSVFVSDFDPLEGLVVEDDSPFEVPVRVPSLSQTIFACPSEFGLCSTGKSLVFCVYLILLPVGVLNSC